MPSKRHQVEDREEFTESQKAMIAKKTDNCCAWCGKKVYFGYGGTVDHYIPLKKGGTNEFDNLVLMCKECNEKKGSMIIPVNIAGYYVKEPYKHKMEEDFETYIHSFEYLSRGNLMCCDAYELFIMPEEFSIMRSKQRRKGKNSVHDYKQSKCLLRRAYPNDADKITEFYAKYLRKYNMLASEEAALENIKFWMRFGAIYYIERSGEISLISAMVVNRHGYLSINIFSYYSNALATTLARGLVNCISEAILVENNLMYLPISVNMLKDDSLSFKVMRRRNTYLVVDGRLDCVPYFIFHPELSNMTSGEYSQVRTKGKEDLIQFLKRFYDVEDQIRMYLHEGNLWDYEWMADEILERDVFTNVDVRNPF